MLINPTYGAGGAQASGYVEDGAVAIHENRSWETADLYQRISGNLDLPQISTTTGFTIETRVAPTLSPNNYSSFFSIEGSGKRVLLGQTTTSEEKDETSDYGLDVWGWASGSETIFKPANISYSDWHTFSFSADANAFKLYIDGRHFETRAAISWEVTPVDISQMYYPYTGRYTKGKWGCTRWYNRVLTADEIAANYAIDAERYNET